MRAGERLGPYQIAARLGEQRCAVELLRHAIAESLNLGEVHADFGLELLRGDPPFDEVVGPKG